MTSADQRSPECSKMADDGSRERRLEVIPTGDPDDETCATFVMHEEDHTLGNALRYMIMKNADVSFCGYSVPHPSENKINLRIQTKDMPASDVLRRGLSELTALCEHVLATFESSVEEYGNKSEQDGKDEDVSMSEGED